MLPSIPRGCSLSLLLLLSMVLSACQNPQVPVPVESAPPASRRVAALGKLEPRDRVVEVGVPGDERLGRLVVKEGQTVVAGDVLAYLQSFETRTAARDRAAAQLQDMEARLHADSEQGSARIQEATLRLKQLKEVPPLELQAQNARIREAQSDLDLALLNLERMRSLLDSTIIPRQDFDRQAALVTRSRATLESEQATLQKLTRAADTDREVAEAQLVTRTRELESTRAAAQLDSLKRALQVAESDLKDAVVRAPSDGQIIEVVANPGESLLNRVILRMGDVSQMYALTEVYETDMAHVQLGQTAEISSPALSVKLTGVVDRLGTSVFRRKVRSIDPQADVDARIVQVRVKLDKSEEAARFVGLQVDVLIHTGN